MKNALLIILVVAGLFIFGCTGQNTTTQTDQQTAQQLAEQHAAQQAAQQAAAQQAAEQQAAQQQALQQAAQQALQNQTLPEKFECPAGTHYSNQGGLQGTIVGVETYKGRQACHISYSFSPEAMFDYYLDMSNPTDFCTVMSGGPGTESTEVCNWQ